MESRRKIGTDRCGKKKTFGSSGIFTRSVGDPGGTGVWRGVRRGRKGYPPKEIDLGEYGDEKTKKKGSFGDDSNGFREEKTSEWPKKSAENSRILG